MKGNHSARVRACASERVSMWVLVFACASFRCFFVVLEQVFLHIDVGMRIQALAVVFTRFRSQ